MKNYIITLVGVALLSGRYRSSRPRRDEKIHKSSRGSRCAVCVVIAPFGSVIKALASKTADILTKSRGGKRAERLRSIYLENFKIHGAESLAEGFER
jgi:hypothetical protein